MVTCEFGVKTIYTDRSWGLLFEALRYITKFWWHCFNLLVLLISY